MTTEVNCGFLDSVRNDISNRMRLLQRPLFYYAIVDVHRVALQEDVAERLAVPGEIYLQDVAAPCDHLDWRAGHALRAGHQRGSRCARPAGKRLALDPSLVCPDGERLAGERLDEVRVCAPGGEQLVVPGGAAQGHNVQGVHIV